MNAAEVYELTTQGGATDFARMVQSARRLDLRIQFSTDPRYQAFPGRAEKAVVLGVAVRGACLRDTVQGELWLTATRAEG